MRASTATPAALTPALPRAAAALPRWDHALAHAAGLMHRVRPPATWASSLAAACALVAAAAGVSLALPLAADAAAAHGAQRGGLTAAEQAWCTQRHRADGTDLRACRREMIAARHARPGDLTPARQPTNAVDSRCEPLPPTERDLCRLRVRGVDTSAGGGTSATAVLRHTALPPVARPSRRSPSR